MEKENIIVLSFGSNLGDKKNNILKAYKLLERELGTMIKCSSFLETKAWGFESNETFVNSCAKFSTTLTPFESLKVINAVEHKLGRTRSNGAGYEDRVIDIDIIFFNNETIDTSELKIPHPLWEVRDFVKIPLKEIM